LSFCKGDGRGSFGGGGCFVLINIAALRGVVVGLIGRGGDALMNDFRAVRFDDKF
jgi:hypothetical protein